MTKNKRNISPVKFFIAVFVIIMAVMFFTNSRSQLAHKLTGPTAGSISLKTTQSKLTAVSRDNNIFSWDWNNIAHRPVITSATSKLSAPLASNQIITVTEDNAIKVININTGRISEEKLLGISNKCRLLSTSNNGKYAVLVLESGIRKYKAALYIPNKNRLSTSATEFDNLQLNSASVSNDGKRIALAGKANKGILIIIDTGTMAVVQQKQIDDTESLKHVIFSPDNQSVYVSQPGRTIKVFDVQTGRMTEKYEMKKYKTPPNNPQTISCVTISKNGDRFAAATEPASNVTVWDTLTKKRISNITNERYTISGIAFSPDASRLATCILVRSSVNVWKISDNN